MISIMRFLAALTVASWMSTAVMAADDGVVFKPTVQNAAYASGNAIGGLQTVPLLKNVTTTVTRRSGILDAVWLSFVGGATTPVTFYIFDKLPTATTCTDKSAFALGTADIDKLAVAPFALTPAAPTGTTVSMAQLVQATSISNHDDVVTQNVYVCLVVGGSVTPPTTADLIVKMSIALN